MTKSVRIENADTAGYTVVVEVWEKGYTEDPNSVAPNSLVETIELPNACDMTDGIYLTSSRYLVIKEK